MNALKHQQGVIEYVVPASRLAGTQAQVLAQIDELIVGLTGLRELVLLHGPKPEAVPQRKLRLVKRFVAALTLMGPAALKPFTW